MAKRATKAKTPNLSGDLYLAFPSPLDGVPDDLRITHEQIMAMTYWFPTKEDLMNFLRDFKGEEQKHREKAPFEFVGGRFTPLTHDAFNVLMTGPSRNNVKRTT